MPAEHAGCQVCGRTDVSLSRSGRLAAAEAAVARVRALSERLGATDPGLRDEILQALDGTETTA